MQQQQQQRERQGPLPKETETKSTNHSGRRPPSRQVSAVAAVKRHRKRHPHSGTFCLSFLRPRGPPLSPHRRMGYLQATCTSVRGPAVLYSVTHISIIYIIYIIDRILHNNLMEPLFRLFNLIRLNISHSNVSTKQSLSCPKALAREQGRQGDRHPRGACLQRPQLQRRRKETTGDTEGDGWRDTFIQRQAERDAGGQDRDTKKTQKGDRHKETERDRHTQPQRDRGRNTRQGKRQGQSRRQRGGGMFLTDAQLFHCGGYRHRSPAISVFM